MGARWGSLRVRRTNRLEGVVTAPPSKSYTHRALIIGSLSREAWIRNPLLSQDNRATMDVLRTLGAAIKLSPQVSTPSLHINGFQRNPAIDGKTVNVGESGTLLRFLPSVASLGEGTIRIEGRGTLLQRPCGPILKVLRKMGVGASARNDRLPITLVGNGEFRGGRIVVDASQSSQAISSILMVAPYATQDTEIVVKGRLVSMPYIDVTMDVMQRAGVHVEAEKTSAGRYGRFFVRCGQSYHGWNGRTPFHVPGDFSSGGFLLAAACLVDSRVTVRGFAKDRQGDRVIVEVLKKMGGHVKEMRDGKSKSYLVEGPADLRAVEFDGGDYPDLCPIVAMLGAFAEGRTEIRNIGHLTIKESDRIGQTVRIIRELGGKVESGPSWLRVFGNPRAMHGGGSINPSGDHRLAMAAVVAGLRLGQVEVQDPGCIAKSYPGFVKDLRSIGASISPTA